MTANDHTLGTPFDLFIVLVKNAILLYLHYYMLILNIIESVAEVKQDNINLLACVYAYSKLFDREN